MIVVVAEKPSVGRDIARVLGCKTSGEGFLSGDGYTVRKDSCDAGIKET